MTFAQADVDEKRAKASSILTAEDLVKQVDVFCDEYILSDEDYCNAMKVIGVLDDDEHEQQAF